MFANREQNYIFSYLHFSGLPGQSKSQSTTPRLFYLLFSLIRVSSFDANHEVLLDLFGFSHDIQPTKLVRSKTAKLFFSYHQVPIQSQFFHYGPILVFLSCQAVRLNGWTHYKWSQRLWVSASPSKWLFLISFYVCHIPTLNGYIFFFFPLPPLHFHLEIFSLFSKRELCSAQALIQGQRQRLILSNTHRKKDIKLVRFWEII